MHPILKNLLLIGLLAGTLSAAPLPTVYEGLNEFLAFGDFDGDGDLDPALVDRATGQIRFGTRSASTISWTDAVLVDSGVVNVSSVAVGRLRALDRDTLILTTPNANRLTVLGMNDNSTLPQAIGEVGTGPALVFAIDLPGAGDTDFADLAVYSQSNFQPEPRRWTLLRNADGTAAVQQAEQAAAVAIARADAFSMPDQDGTLLAALETLPPLASLVILQPESTGLTEIVRSGPISSGSGFAYAPFSRGSDIEFIIYSGQALSCLRLTPAGDLEPVAAVQGFDLGRVISQVMVFEQKRLSWEAAEKLDRHQLGVLFADGTAAIYEFDGETAPRLLQTVAASGGRSVTGLVGIDYDWGRLHVLEGTAGVTTTVSAYSYDWGDGTYHPQFQYYQVAELSATVSANVLLFREEPFVAPDPGLVARYRKGTWTGTTFGLTNPTPSLNVRSEDFVGEAMGLAYPGVYNLGAAPSGAAFALTNQFRTDASMFSFDAPFGALPLDVEAVPPSGTYDAAFTVAFRSPEAAASIYYRRNSADAWTRYAPPAEGDLSLVVSYDQTFEYFAESGSGERSPIRQAVYTFTSSRFELDSDGDGVPDFVELAQGLDPVNSGPDGDHDGILDLEEVLGEPLCSTTQFAIWAHPLVHDGTPAASYIDTGKGTWVNAYNSLGSPLGSARTVNVTTKLGTTARATLNGVNAATAGLILVATQPEFTIVSAAGPTVAIGRETLGLIPEPDLTRPALAYAYSGGTLSEEVDAWIAEARSKWARTAVAVPTVAVEFSPRDTLAVLLLEGILDDILRAAGLAPAESALSLTPFRQDEVEDSYLLDSTLFRQLAEGDAKHPGQDLQELYVSLNVALQSPGSTDIGALLTLANDIYRLHIESPAGQLRRPITVLREFIASGVLDAAYTKQLGERGEPEAAAAGVALLLATRAPRTLVTRTVVIQEDSFATAGAVTVLDAADPTMVILLVNALGGPGIGSSAFGLAPGIEIDVTGYLREQSPQREVIEVVSAAVSATPAPAAGLDLDDDGIDDAWELLFFGTTDAAPDADPDDDGSRNLAEFRNGTDPLDPQSVDAPEAPTELAVDSIYRTDHQFVEFVFTLPEGYDNLDYDLEIAVGSDFADLLASVTSSAAPGRTTHTVTDFIPTAGPRQWRVRCRTTSGDVSQWAVAPTPVTTSFVFAVHAGWNLLAAPVDTDQTVGEIFPTLVRPLWRWNTETKVYVPVPTDAPLAGGVAYWFWHDGELASEPFTGPVPDQLPALHVGWNPVGECPGLRWVSDAQTAQSVWLWDAVAMQYVSAELASLLAQPQVWFAGYWTYRYPAP